MKKIFLTLALFVTTFSFSQLSGDIATAGRKITQPISYTLEMKAATSSKLVFDIAVNTEGKVTSCEFNKTESTIYNTRYIYEAKNRILTQLKFEAGNGYPTFHQGRIIITTITAANK